MPLLAFSRSEFKVSHDSFLIFYLIVLSLKVRRVFYGLLHQRTVAQAFGSLPYLRTAVSVDFTMTISQGPSLRVCVCRCRSVFTRFLFRLVFLGRQRNYVQWCFKYFCVNFLTRLDSCYKSYPPQKKLLIINIFLWSHRHLIHVIKIPV